MPTTHALYWMCRLSATDPAFERYPRLPIIQCAGYLRREPEAGAGKGER